MYLVDRYCGKTIVNLISNEEMWQALSCRIKIVDDYRKARNL